MGLFEVLELVLCSSALGTLHMLSFLSREPFLSLSTYRGPILHLKPSLKSYFPGTLLDLSSDNYFCLSPNYGVTLFEALWQHCFVLE